MSQQQKQEKGSEQMAPSSLALLLGLAGNTQNNQQQASPSPQQPNFDTLANALYGTLLLQQLQGMQAPQMNLQPEIKKGGRATKDRRSSVMSTMSQMSEGGEDGQGTGKRRSRSKSSNYRGVSRCAKDGRWQARIRIGRDVIYLGRYKTELDAARRYDIAAKKHHGSRAVLNFSDSDPEAALTDAERERLEAGKSSSPDSDQEADSPKSSGDKTGEPAKKKRRASTARTSASRRSSVVSTGPPVQQPGLPVNQYAYQQLFTQLQQAGKDVTKEAVKGKNGEQENLQPLWSNFLQGQANPFLLGLTSGMLSGTGQLAADSPFLNLAGVNSASSGGRASSHPATSSQSSQPAALPPKSPSSDMRGAINGLISLNAGNM